MDDRAIELKKTERLKRAVRGTNGKLYAAQYSDLYGRANAIIVEVREDPPYTVPTNDGKTITIDPRGSVYRCCQRGNTTRGEDVIEILPLSPEAKAALEQQIAKRWEEHDVARK